jgi:hypothetical protein
MGRDLLFFRFKGSMVGGLVGLVIYVLSKLAGYAALLGRKRRLGTSVCKRRLLEALVNRARNSA